MSQREVVIISGARTPLGKLKGALANLSAVELGTIAVKAAIERSKVDVSDVAAVILGQVLQAGSGQGPARQVSVASGLGWNVPTITINKLCLSGLTAVIDAARLIRTGEA
ncbi:MAG: acetyl-CoA C-acyltransferase, partial [Microbacteriaceae bacterium]|nr:acetyl-CoA C-acyltransferase [Microbacteriaceae bacterium]